MSKAKVAEREDKAAEAEAMPQGYVLTKKGEQAARKTGKWVGSLDDVILRIMAKSPNVPLTKGTLSDDLWQRASEILAQLEDEGLVEAAEAEAKPGKAKVVVEDTGKPSKLKLDSRPKPKAFGLTKVVYSDKKGERLARKKRRGWKPVKY
jgi:hypothetical protein